MNSSAYIDKQIIIGLSIFVVVLLLLSIGLNTLQGGMQQNTIIINLWLLLHFFFLYLLYKVPPNEKIFVYIFFLFSIVYYVIPLLYINIWHGLGFVSNDTVFNTSLLLSGDWIFNFLFEWVALLIGILIPSYIFNNRMRKVDLPRLLSPFRYQKHFIISLYIVNVIVILSISYEFSNYLYNVYDKQQEPPINLLSQLLQDKSLILFDGFAVYKIAMINRGFKKHAIFLFIIAVLLLSLSGSKGAIFFSIILFVFFPLVIMNKYGYSLYISFKSIVAASLLSVVIYFAVYSLRINYYSYSSLMDSFSLLPENIIAVVNSIINRLSIQGIDHTASLISFYNNIGKSCFVPIDLFQYQAMNFLNLILPGTVYMEAYSPSSMQYNNILHSCQVIYGQFDRTTLFYSLNTQPYTIFGYFYIMFGNWSYFMLIMYGFFVSLIYYFVNNFFVKLMLGIFFFSFMSNFGLEDSLFTSIQLTVSFAVIFILLNFIIKLIDSYRI